LTIVGTNRTGCWISDAGYLMLDARYKILYIGLDTRYQAKSRSIEQGGLVEL
jgi:hypothetical protein